mmetsp:Transcript_7604/g.23721  ORF Transcript_7604/g.23721 Transcript_7604/m.23721 type:complete len:225 (-) Transcript_7604:26-700(-)
MAFGWSQRTGMQKFALIVAIIAVIVMAVCLVANIVTTAQAAEETWFVRCDDCERNGGDEECGDKCCSKCTRKDAWLFYTMRAYSMLFCILAIVAEVYTLKFFRRLFAIFKYAWGRGLLQIFVGFLTLTGNLAPDDPDAATIIAGVGWVGIVLGIVHLFLSCCCFKEYKDVAEEREAAQGDAPSGAAAGGGGQSSQQPQSQQMSGVGPQAGGPQQQQQAPPKYAV